VSLMLFIAVQYASCACLRKTGLLLLVVLMLNNFSQGNTCQT
jgi:hypothetical protein